MARRLSFRTETNEKEQGRNVAGQPAEGPGTMPGHQPGNALRCKSGESPMNKNNKNKTKKIPQVLELNAKLHTREIHKTFQIFLAEVRPKQVIKFIQN